MNMKTFRKVNIAVSILLHEKKRLTLSILAISFAVLVIFMEQGFFYGLLDSQVRLYEAMNADLVIMDSKQLHINKFTMMRRASLYQTLGFEEVAEVVPVYKFLAKMKNPQTDEIFEIFCLAFPPESEPFKLSIEEQHRESLKSTGTLLFDRAARKNLGRAEIGGNIEINELDYKVGGFCTLGPTFTFDGHFSMSEASRLEHIGGTYSEQTSFGLLRVKSGTDIQALKSKIIKVVDEDVILLTPDELRRREIAYITKTMPLGAIFGVGMIIGFIIGTIICYQILYNQIIDHIPQFATMRAMGFTDGYLKRIVLQQTMLLAVLGYLQGLLLSQGLYYMLFINTGIPFVFTVGRIAFVFILTFAMCIIAGMIASRKLSSADPADLF